MIKTHPVKNPTPAKVVETVSQEIARKSTKIQDYPQPIRIATVKALRSAKYSAKRISEILGMSQHTVLNYIDTSLDNEWQRYSTAVNQILTERKDTLRALTDNAIEVKLQDTDKVQLRDLTGLYRVLNEVSSSVPQHASINQIINVHPALERKVIVQDQ